jgi:spermidine synthase
VVAGMFFLTGATALIYQQLWLRELSLVFGVTIEAVATVLASFFAGLALGSAVAGRLVGRARCPIRWYALIEILVGLSALATPAALSIIEDWYVDIARALPDSQNLVSLARFALSFGVLVLPATLMGASLPIVVMSVGRQRGRLGQRVSVLYAVNTAGAITGTILAGYWLIGKAGILFSFRLAAAVNIAVGGAAYLASRRWERPLSSRSAMPDDRSAPSNEEVLSAPARMVILSVFTASGFVALALEVVWFRVLVLHFESNTYAFTIMLATVLAGIAIGSALISPFMRRHIDWLRLLCLIELALAFVALLSLLLLAEAYDLVDPAKVRGGDLWVIAIGAAAAILPTTLLMGAAFPIGMRLWAGADTRDAGRRVGAFYSLNVAGGIAGSLVAGFFLIPTLGARRSVQFLALVLLASGIALALLTTKPRFRVATIGTALAGFLVVSIAAVPDPYEAVIAHRYPGEEVLWIEDGAQTTVSVHELADGTRAMYLDGLHQASDHPAVVEVHRQIGILPVALHPDPSSALVVGLGGGVTAGSVREAQADGTVEIVELSEEVVRASHFFRRVNGDVLRQRNVRLRIDDGRNHLLLAEHRYDVITSDIIQPEHSGASKLWSVEYWELARKVLRDDGIMLQWIGTGRPVVQYELIMRSFLEAFPHATLWFEGNLMIGSKQPLSFDGGALEAKSANPSTRAALASIGVTSFESLLDRYTAGPDEMRALVGSGPLLTDDRPRIEYFRTVGGDQTPLDTERLQRRLDATDK